MKFLIMLALLMAGALHAEIPLHVDGTWLDSGCYGCPGDKVRAEMKAQQAAYDEAKEALADDYSAANLVMCAHTALFSYVKAGYLLEAAHAYEKGGDNEKAINFYRNAAEAAYAAIQMQDNEKFNSAADGFNIPKRSRAEGKKWLKHANKMLVKLGAGEVTK